jgi:predicted acylesterase/phospholipase RssA
VGPYRTTNRRRLRTNQSGAICRHGGADSRLQRQDNYHGYRNLRCCGKEGGSHPLLRGATGVFSFAGGVSRERLGELVNDELQGRGFSDLERDLAVIATDVEKRRRVIFIFPRVAKRLNRSVLHGFLPPPREARPGIETVIVSDLVDVGLAVRASSAVPGAFMPVELRGMRLLDRGFVDQPPVDVVRAMGANVAIGVSLGLSFMPQQMNCLKSAISATIGTLGVHQLWRSLELADIGFEVEGIQVRSPVKPGQVYLMHLGERDANGWFRAFTRRPRWLPRVTG